MKTIFKELKWTEKWGYINSIKLETNLVSIEQKGGWMLYEQFGGCNTKQGSGEALKFYNSIVTN
tara:strand:+ start:680 stop:871 length:192 start_codon:yes stop_codon:yes gene_type:complete